MGHKDEWTLERGYKCAVWVLLAFIVVGGTWLSLREPSEKMLPILPAPSRVLTYVDGCIADPHSCNGDFIIVGSGEHESIYKFTDGLVPYDDLGVGISTSYMLINRLWFESLKTHDRLGEINSIVTLDPETLPSVYWLAAEKFYKRQSK